LKKNQDEREKLPEWFDNDRLDTLAAFRSYLRKRSSELTEALTAGVGLDTWDPYLNGFALGMKSGLQVAEDLVYSYAEWVTREVYYPDERSAQFMYQTSKSKYLASFDK